MKFHHVCLITFNSPQNISSLFHYNASISALEWPVPHMGSAMPHMGSAMPHMGSAMPGMGNPMDRRSQLQLAIPGMGYPTDGDVRRQSDVFAHGNLTTRSVGDLVECSQIRSSSSMRTASRTRASWTERSALHIPLSPRTFTGAR